MNIRFFNGTILTLENGTELSSGEVWVFDHLIGYVGKPQDNNIKWDREINLNGNLIMPGFKDAHTHSAMTFLRSFADDLPLDRWLNERVFPMEAKLNDDLIYAFSKIAIMEYLTSGITSNFDMYISPNPVIQASIDCGFRTVMTGGLNNFTQTVEEIDECYKKYNGYNPLISYELGFHAEYTCSRELLEGMASIAKKHQAPVFCHNSETKKEVKECLDRYGTTPTVFLDRLGMFNYGGGGYHCVHMTKDDISVFEKHGLSVVTNPGSNAKLASGVASISEKAVKQVRNNINRRINSEVANITKIASASAKQLAAIQKIKDKKGIESLPDDLREIAVLRLENPEMSLRDLGQNLSVPISRSGANHRMNRLLEYAEDLE